MYDYLIIGQGIAGTTLAHQLLNEGKSVFIIDDNPISSSSKIASGLWNPIVLKRMKKVWLADQMIEELNHFYTSIEKKTNSNFIENLKIQRILHSIEEQNNWHEIGDTPKFKGYLSDKIETNLNDQIKAPQGLGTVLKSGRINVLQYLEASRTHFISLGIYDQQRLKIESLNLQGEHIEYNSFKAKEIILCQGQEARLNKWFDYLPFAPTKGEVMIGSSELNQNQPLHGGKFILPLGGSRFKIGATYAWDPLDLNPTKKGESQLKEGWEKISSATFNPEIHQVGIRPTVKDRRPLLGTHPEHQRLHIFNGLGSRGILMAPYLAKMLVNNLVYKTPIHLEADISRFTNLLN